MATTKELEHEITVLALDIERVGNEAIQGTKSFADAKTEMDRMQLDIEGKQAEHAVKTRYDETKAANLARISAGADSNAGEKDAAQLAAEHAMINAHQHVVKSIGQQWAESDVYKALLNGGMQGKSWQSGSVETKATLAEATGGIGAALGVTPALLPGLTNILFADLTVADLIPNGVSDGYNFRYIVESAVTNAAATVAESGTKPLSDLTFAVVDDRLRKIATLLQVTDEMLADVSMIASYIDTRLALFIKIAEETQLLLGDGTAENLTGLMNRAGKQTTIVKGTAPSLVGDNDMDVILRQITAVRIGSFLEPDAIVIDPASWQTILLSKAATAGTYLGGGPFTPQSPSLWGKKVVVSPRMTAGAALVGAFAQAAQIWRKGGIVIDASNSHNLNFAINQTTIRAEERLALSVYRPGAFGVVTGL
jgi:HK97 family phage major capsid protein